MALFLLIAFSVVNTADARQFGRDRFMSPFDRGLMGIRTLKALDLSSEQESTIIDIIDKYNDHRQNSKDDLDDAQRSLREALQAEEMDEGAIRVAFHGVSTIREEMLVMRAKMMSKIKTILTPEQIELLEQQRSERMDRMKRRFDRRESMSRN